MGGFEEDVASLQGGLQSGVFEAMLELAAVFLLAGEECVGDRGEAMAKADQPFRVEGDAVAGMEDAEGMGSPMEFSIESVATAFLAD